MDLTRRKLLTGAGVATGAAIIPSVAGAADKTHGDFLKQVYDHINSHMDLPMSRKKFAKFLMTLNNIILPHIKDKEVAENILDSEINLIHTIMTAKEEIGVTTGRYYWTSVVNYHLISEDTLFTQRNIYYCPEFVLDDREYRINVTLSMDENKFTVIDSLSIITEHPFRKYST